ncbi:unnamed protein product [Closterium sp. NIES-65]|nr:unnamed protein product [Closterium sp. NIES-65]
MATPNVLTFDAEGRAVDFAVWVDGLQHFLQCDRKDGLSLFDLTSGASTALAADADSTVRSQWATRDAAARLAVRSHLPSTERAHFRALEELAGAVEVAVEAAEGMGVAVGVVAGVGASVAAAEAEAAATVAVGAEEAAETAVAEVAAAVVELVGRGEGAGPCAYVLRTGDHTGELCGGPHTTQRCFGRLMDAWRLQFPDATEIPHWGELLRSRVAIFDLDYDAILAAMYVVFTSDEGDCYLCVPPDPGIEAAALGAA